MTPYNVSEFVAEHEDSLHACTITKHFLHPTGVIHDVVPQWDHTVSLLSCQAVRVESLHLGGSAVTARNDLDAIHRKANSGRDVCCQFYDLGCLDPQFDAPGLKIVHVVNDASFEFLSGG